jgi:hypothetical protein
MQISDLTNETSIEESNNKLAQIIQKLNKIEKSLPELIAAVGHGKARDLVLTVLEEIPDQVAHYYSFWYPSTKKLLKKYKVIRDRLQKRIDAGLNERKENTMKKL